MGNLSNKIIKSKTLLISLARNADNVSLKYIHAAIKDAGFSSELLFYTSDDESYFPLITDLIKEHGINVVGLSLMSIYFNKAATLSTYLKKMLGDEITIVWGGIHPTIDSEGSKMYSDYVCIGEADTSFADFLGQWRPGSPDRHVDGFVRGSDQKKSICASPINLDFSWYPQHFSKPSFVTDNGKIKPMCLRLFKKYSRYRGSMISVMTTRGCPFKCSYCCNDLVADTFGRKIRERSPENVIREIKENIRDSKVYINYISMLDDCFVAHSKEWFGRFAQLYNELGYKIPIIFRAIPQFIDEEKIKILSQVPCGFAAVGLQSGSPRVLEKIYKRKHSTEKFIQSARILDTYNIPAMYDVIVDNPYESEEDWKETIKVVSNLPKSSGIFYYSLTFYKHTTLYKMAKKDGINVDAHLTKDQNEDVDHTSREVMALRMSRFLGSPSANRFLDNKNIIEQFIMVWISAFLCIIVEPVQIVKLGYLSQRRNKVRFVRLLLTSGKEFIHNKLAGR